MELSYLLMKQILSMALMVLMGFTLVKKKILRSEQSNVLSAVTVYLACPCMIISAFQIEFSADKLYGLVVAFVAAITAQVVLILLGHLVKKPLGLSAVECGSMIYSNGGNLLIPLVSALLGKEFVFYTCAFIAAQNVLIWTHGVWLMGGSENGGWKKIVTNPNIVGIVVGLSLFVARIPLPSILATTVDNVGAIIGPVCMFLIGMLMADSDLKEVFRRGKNYLVCGARLLVCPALFILGVRISGITMGDETIKSVLLVTMLAVSAPVAVAVTQIANLYKSIEDAKIAGSINVMSVILCIVTMPVMTAFYQFLC